VQTGKGNGESAPKEVPLKASRRDRHSPLCCRGGHIQQVYAYVTNEGGTAGNSRP